MEEACIRLREEIESLHIENRRLENIYFTNGISRISKTNNEEQLTKWVDETLKNLSSKESLSSDNRIVYLLSKTLGWTLDSCLSNTKLSNNGKSSVIDWQTKWSHKNFGDVSAVNMNFTVSKGPESEKITHLSIDLEGLSKDTEELKPLVEKYTELCEPSTFFTHFESYLHMNSTRKRYLENNDIQAQVHEETGFCRIIFYDPTLKPLVRIQWKIIFDKVSEEFNELYQVAFTKLGLNHAQEYNFPEELFSHGYVPHWTVVECISNLSKLSLFTPVKKIKRKKLT